MPEPGLVLRISPPLADDERGPAPAPTLERAAGRAGPRTRSSSSFYGQSASDNPLGIHRALGERGPRRIDIGASRTGRSRSRRVASVSSRATAMVAGPRRHACSSSTTGCAKRFRRRRSRHVPQTWHGTMLKRLALDPRPACARASPCCASAPGGTPARARTHSERIFRPAYAMRGPIWVDSYPRNDILALPQAERATRRDAVRTPPWGHRDAWCSTPPPGAMTAPRWSTTWISSDSRARLGDDHVLLVRGHSAPCATARTSRAPASSTSRAIRT
ncbi:MAG: CDP-glycerol glycerophosphotransferase family protein [Schumannella sp.]